MPSERRRLAIAVVDGLRFSADERFEILGRLALPGPVSGERSSLLMGRTGPPPPVPKEFGHSGVTGTGESSWRWRTFSEGLCVGRGLVPQGSGRTGR